MPPIKEAVLSATAASNVNNGAEALTALAQGRNTLVWQRVVADTETPVGGALKLIEEGRGDFLLESVEGGEIRGRYSLLGLDPDLLFRATGASAQINRNWRQDRSAFEPLAGDSMAELRNLAQACRIDVPAELPPALACLVGYFGYETIGLVEKLPRAPQSPLELPDMLFVRPALVLIFDRLTDALFVIAPLWADNGDPARKVERAVEQIDTALRKLDAKVPAAPRLADTSRSRSDLSPEPGHAAHPMLKIAMPRQGCLPTPRNARNISCCSIWGVTMSGAWRRGIA